MKGPCAQHEKTEKPQAHEEGAAAAPFETGLPTRVPLFLRDGVSLTAMRGGLQAPRCLSIHAQQCGQQSHGSRTPTRAGLYRFLMQQNETIYPFTEACAVRVL